MRLLKLKQIAVAVGTIGALLVADGAMAVTSYIDPSISASAVPALEADSTTLMGYLTAIGMITLGGFFAWRIFKRITHRV